MIDLPQYFQEQASARYIALLSILGSQVRAAFSGAGERAPREDAVATANGAARLYLSGERNAIELAALETAQNAHRRALSELGVKDYDLPTRLLDYVSEASEYASQLLASQVGRDVMTVAQAIQTKEMRIDLYVRTGRHTQASAAAAVAIEDRVSPAFSFQDRSGRSYKSAKHVRDIYRTHMMTIANEVFLATATDHGVGEFFVGHDDPKYRFQGIRVTLDADDEGSFFYDLRDEIFHPSSTAYLTTVESEYVRP